MPRRTGPVSSAKLAPRAEAALAVMHANALLLVLPMQQVQPFGRNSGAGMYFTLPRSMETGSVKDQSASLQKKSFFN